MTRTIYLVACASKKRCGIAPAKDLYVSALFTKTRAYVEATESRWFRAGQTRS